MSSNFTFPDEGEFVKRGFIPSATNNPDSVSYVKQYDGERKLTVTIQPSGNTGYITVEISENDLLLAFIGHGDVTRIESQELLIPINGQRPVGQEMFRVYMRDSDYLFNIIYEYQPAFFYGDPRKL